MNTTPKDRPSGGSVLAPGPGGGPARRANLSLHPLSQRFATVWLWLDNSPLRLVWPFILGGLMAGVALLVTRNIVWAVGLTLLMYVAIVMWGRSVAARLEDLHRLSD